MNYLKVSIGIFLVLAASRFVPHPPNFTSLIALSFYVPALLGITFIPVLIFSFLLTDLIIGFHETTFFTWGSVLAIGLISKYFQYNILKRMSGALIGALIFFLLTNLGVWITSAHGINSTSLINVCLLGLPFFGYSLISTLIFSAIIETICKFKIAKNIIQIYSYK